MFYAGVFLGIVVYLCNMSLAATYTLQRAKIKTQSRGTI